MNTTDPPREGNHVGERPPAEVVDRAKQCMTKAGIVGIEPEPAFAVDAGTTWQLFFKFKERMEQRDGTVIAVKQLPEFARVDVRKDDLTASVVPTR